MQVGELFVALKVDLSGLQRSLEQARTQVSGLGNKLSSALKAAEPGSKALAAALAGVAAAAGVLGVKAVTMAGQMEQSRIAFTTMLGSAEKADAFLRDLYDFAARTPFEIEGLQQSARQLLAFGFSAEQIIPMMTSIGNAVSGLGGGAAEIDRVTRALGQMQAKGKVSAEEMMQLAELGIPAWEILAEKIGVDIPTAMKMAEQGAIPAAQAIEGLVTGMNERFPDMMEKQSETLLGLWSSLQDNISMSLVAIGDEIVETFDLKNKLVGAIEALERLSGLLQEKGLKGALAELFPPDLQMKIVMITGAIAGALVPALYALAAGVWAAMAPLLPFMAAGAAIAALAYLIYTNWDGVGAFFVNLWEGVKTTTLEAWEGLKSILSEAWEAIKAVFFSTSPVGIIIKHWDQIKQVTAAMWDAIKTLSSDIWNGIKDTLTGIWDAIKGAVESTWQAIQTLTRDIWTGISTWLSDLWERIKTQITKAWTDIYTTISDIWKRVQEGFGGLVKAAWDWGKNLLGEFIAGIKSKLSDLWDTLTDIGDTVAGFLGFHSPTKLGAGREADKWAPNFVKMFAEGLQAGIPHIEIAVSDLADRMAALTPAALGPAISHSHSTSNNYGGNVFHVTVTGGSTREQAEDLMRELHRLGVRF